MSLQVLSQITPFYIYEECLQQARIDEMKPYAPVFEIVLQYHIKYF